MQQLEQNRRVLAEIIAGLPVAARFDAARRLVRVSRLAAEQQKFDLAVEAALERIQLTKRLRKRSKKNASA